MVGRPRADDRMVINRVYYMMFLLLDIDGLICLLGVVCIRLLGRGLRDGVIKVSGIEYLRLLFNEYQIERFKETNKMWSKLDVQGIFLEPEEIREKIFIHKR